MTESRLRELYEQALAARGAGARERCVTPEAMLALVRREGSEDERLATLDHVMACAACSRELELLRAIERAGAESGAADAVTPAAEREATADVVPIRPRARPTWQRFVPLALAASLLLAIGVGVLQRDGGPGVEDVVRGDVVGVTLLAPAAEVARGAPVTFAWRPVPDAVRYELELLDATGTVVYSATTGDTTAMMGDARRLEPGGEYRWWVRGVDAGGAQRASAMRHLRVRSE